MPFETGGISAEMDKINRLAKNLDATCKSAVKAGGNALAKALSAAAPVDTGALTGSIKAGNVTYDAANGFSCEVAPKGNHPVTGEPLAKVGNILEYGRTNLPPRSWFNPTIAKAEPEVLAAMQAELQKLQGG